MGRDDWQMAPSIDVVEVRPGSTGNTREDGDVHPVDEAAVAALLNERSAARLSRDFAQADIRQDDAARSRPDCARTAANADRNH